MPTVLEHESVKAKGTFKLGRKRPVARCPRLSLKNYLTQALPAPPSHCDYSTLAADALSKLYGNNVLGDCVIAAIAHIVGVFTGNAGEQPVIYNQPDIISLYSAIGGYVPGEPSTDQGCDEQTALNYWENKGAPAGSHQIAGWLAVDASNPVEYRTALWLFENLCIGFELPDSWINPYPASSGFTWDVDGNPDPNNGHCVAGVGYGGDGIKVATWGMTGLLTDAAVAAYCNESTGGGLYTVISFDSINRATQKAASGFDWSQLIADFDSMGGQVTASVSLRKRR